MLLSCRLFKTFFRRYHWMHNATAYNHAYNDSGVFCVHASSHPSQLRELVDVITREFVGMAGVIEDSELSVITSITFYFYNYNKNLIFYFNLFFIKLFNNLIFIQL